MTVSDNDILFLAGATIGLALCLLVLRALLTLAEMHLAMQMMERENIMLRATLGAAASNPWPNEKGGENSPP